MEGFEAATYGDAFADVYDEWYSGISDTEATVALIADLAGGAAVLELGIGTGRLALPLAAAGVEVSGIDASAAMLSQLRAKPGGDQVVVVPGDMAEVDAPGDGSFGLVFVAYNTFFNLTTKAAQQRCVERVADRLAPGGRFVIEAFVPADDGDEWHGPFDVRAIELDRVVLSISQRDIRNQTIKGQYVELAENGIRMRPWLIRYALPAEIDAMAAAAGFVLENRWAGWEREPFDDSSPTQVSVYRRSGGEV